MPVFKKIVIPFSTLTLLLISCGSIKPAAPPVEVGTYVQPEQKVSVITIPVEMELKNYFKTADNSVPFEFKGKEQHCEGVSFSYEFERKPIQIDGKGRYVDIDIEGKYGLSLSYCAKCTDLFGSGPSCITPRIPASCGVGEPMRRIKIQYGTEIDLKDNYRIEAKTELKKIDPKDKCQITVFNYDATSHLVKEVKKSLADLGGKIDEAIANLDIKKELEGVWGSFTKPFPIQQYGFLSLDPREIDVDKLQIKGSKLSFQVDILAYPKVTLQKPAEKKTSLPNLTEVKSNGGFQIYLDIIAPYDSLTSIINQSLSQKEIDIKNQKIILQSAKIHGAQNQKLSIEVGFTGSKTGVMYFVGTPKFNDSLQIISFPDLEFDLETKNVLLKSAKWLFNSKITDMIRKYSTLDMTPYLSDASKLIEKQMNTKLDGGIRLSGGIDKTKIKTIFPDQDKLLIQTNLAGKLHVAID